MNHKNMSDRALRGAIAITDAGDKIQRVQKEAN
jgi:hypothetical protein